MEIEEVNIICVGCRKEEKVYIKTLKEMTWKCECGCEFWEFTDEELRKKYQKIEWGDENMKSKLDLQDYKNAENAADAHGREAAITVEINSVVRKFLKKRIVELGGKTSEEERREKKKEIKENTNGTQAG